MNKIINQKLGAMIEELKGLFEANPNSWKPGDAVPKGYKVVFGQLRLMQSAGTTHDVSTQAYKASASANTRGGHLRAAMLHRDAAARHDEASGGPAPRPHLDARDAHLEQAAKHEKSASSPVVSQE